MTSPGAASGVVVVDVAPDDVGGEALRWAVREAAVHGWRLRVVTVWDYPRLPPARPGVSLVSYPTPEALCAELDRVQAAMVAEALAEVPGQTPGPALGGERPGPALGSGAPPERLLLRPSEVPRALADADLLVLTTGAPSGIDLLLDSGRRALAASARCPIVLVPGTGR